MLFYGIWSRNSEKMRLHKPYGYSLIDRDKNEGITDIMLEFSKIK